jgi:hypothetical protein
MSNSTGRKRTGKWRVEKDQLCIEFEQEMPNCYEGVGVGEKSQAATRGSPADGSDRRTAIRSHMTQVNSSAAVVNPHLRETAMSSEMIGTFASSINPEEENQCKESPHCWSCA